MARSTPCEACHSRWGSTRPLPSWGPADAARARSCICSADWTHRAGEIYFRGTPLSRIDRDQYRAREIGFVFQSFHVLGTLSAVENVQIPMFESDLSRRQRVERAEWLIDQVGLAHRRNHRPMHLSVGERQRVAIARALANEPSLLLADEPTGNLDSQSQNEVLELLNDLRQKQGLTLVIITHSPEVAAATERVIKMKDGRVVEG